MRRRDFFKNGSMALLGTSVLGKTELINTVRQKQAAKSNQARNIIFLVSDGMSTGTLNMTDLYLRRMNGKPSTWISLYEQQKVVRALMDTASASSMVTDSAAGSSAWGGGVRVRNGSLNVAADGTRYVPILQKFKSTGKSVGCVTTVPIAHATPAGFCINNNKRGDMNEIAEQYLPLRLDVMMGGGRDNFTAGSRSDKKDLISDYRNNGYQILQHRNELNELNADNTQPLLGLFNDGGLPYSLDRNNSTELTKAVPTLAEMTNAAISKLNKNKNGFVLQVESGKVDWAAHANDISALIYEQIEFDHALRVAVDFAEKDGETLVIMTTDHGNANPGLFYGEKADRNFDRIQHFRQTNDWLLTGIHKNMKPAQIQERSEAAMGIAFTAEEAGKILAHYKQLQETGVYNPRHLPFRELALIQSNYTSVGWGSMDHSADYVELAGFGPGSELIKPFLKNTDLHNLMLSATKADTKLFQNAHHQ